MEKTLESLRGEFGSLRAGRAHISLLDGNLVFLWVTAGNQKHCRQQEVDYSFHQ